MMNIERNIMIGFHITVPKMQKRSLIAFVRRNMPSTHELVRRAKLAKVALRCNKCGATLEEVCKRYEKIPTEDSGLQFRRMSDGNYQIMQLASGGDTCREMREGVCRIVHRHLLKQFRLSKVSHIGCII
jgi:hypothetical protein